MTDSTVIDIWLFLGIVPVAYMMVAAALILNKTEDRYGVAVDSLITAALWGLGMAWALWMM